MLIWRFMISTIVFLYKICYKTKTGFGILFIIPILAMSGLKFDIVLVPYSTIFYSECLFIMKSRRLLKALRMDQIRSWKKNKETNNNSNVLSKNRDSNIETFYLIFSPSQSHWKSKIFRYQLHGRLKKIVLI